jgi:hypothetical protein
MTELLDPTEPGPVDDVENPYDAPRDDNPYDAPGDAALADTADYRPWSRGRVWAIFILGMHAGGFMTFFFHPVFSFFGFGCGLPAVILSSREIRDYPAARTAGPVKWGRITGFIGLIGGAIAFVLFWGIMAAVFSLK